MQRAQYIKYEQIKHNMIENVIFYTFEIVLLDAKESESDDELKKSVTVKTICKRYIFV